MGWFEFCDEGFRLVREFDNKFETEENMICFLKEICGFKFCLVYEKSIVLLFCAAVSENGPGIMIEKNSKKS